MHELDALLVHVIMLLSGLTPPGNSEARNNPAKHFSGNFTCPGISLTKKGIHLDPRSGLKEILSLLEESIEDVLSAILTGTAIIL